MTEHHKHTAERTSDSTPTAAWDGQNCFVDPSRRQGTHSVPGTCPSEGEAGRHDRTRPESTPATAVAETADSEPLSVRARLARIAEQARKHPERAFTTLAHHIDVAMLLHAFSRLNPRGAPGIDRVTWRKYRKNLKHNVEDLHRRLVNRTYTPLPVRRHYIPKGKGKMRPLGLPAIEDKIVAKAVQLLLEQIYEQDFCQFSYGFRPGLSCHAALRDLRHQLHTIRVRYVIDCDLSAFFDNITHQQLLRILRKRVKDGSILHLIKLWLQAGILEGKDLVFPEKGSPQGSVISPLLANVYLHEVLDKWFADVVTAHCYGRVVIIRYADDFIIGCSDERDVPRIMKALPLRFAKYGLSTNAEKTHMVPFARPTRRNSRDTQGHSRRTFSFLGFTHYWGPTRRGGYTIKRKTEGKRLVRCIGQLWRWCRDNRHRPVTYQHQILCSKLRGMFHYYGLRCNSECLKAIRNAAIRAWYYWLRRRGGRRLSWRRFAGYLEAHPLPAARVQHPDV